jgi:dipeptidyl-peptidase-3
VNLGNVYGKPNKDSVRFLGEKEEALFLKYYKESLFVVVALHELIGHGSGKIFLQNADGSFNFPKDVKNPFTNEVVTSYYKHGENWHSRFGE